jgi:putative GTP pyrophosphokinase
MSLFPSFEELRWYIKSELVRIQDRGYSAEEIYDCMKAYDNRKEAYKDLIQRFSVQIQSASNIAAYVHSVRVRLKDMYHLADKLVRKCLDKGKGITIDKLFTKEGITDLGGVRILHLRRDEWIHLHDYLVDKDKMPALSLVEKTAYAKPEIQDEYTKEGRFKKDADPEKTEIKYDQEKRYTSLHYIFKGYDPIYGELYFECQVRTLFEEGWGEIDHQVNYPYKANSIVGGYLSSLNSTAHTANDIASKLETLSHIPLFVPWETEQKLERSADKVYCVTPDLKWVANNLDTFVGNVKHSGGTFHYFILKDDDAANQNYEDVKRRLESEHLYNVKVFLKNVEKDKSVVPVIADLLLLENASDPVSRKQRHISVVGAPAQREVSQEEHLDMLITDESAVKRMRKFFERLQ